MMPFPSAMMMQPPLVTGAAAYRYYRAYVTQAAVPGTHLAFVELDLFETSGGPDFALGKTVTASSDGFAWFPSYLTDGDRTGAIGWHAATTAVPQWVMIDLGAGNAKGLHSYQIWCRGGREDQAPGAWVIEGSDDALSFVALDTESGWDVAAWQAGGGSPSRKLFII